MTPTKPPWLRVKALFEQALDLPDAERDAFVGSADCDSDTRAELRSLLQHHAAGSTSNPGTPGFMDGSASLALAGSLGDLSADSLASQAARVGQRLGAWEIVRPVGSGGMGEVFEARRADGQYEGRAAVKLLKRGMDSAAVLQRFAQERQALARLSHPHIARLLDAGASEQGLPYFVLEYVDGQPIDAVVRGLTLPARLQLFLQLADAVAHAHRCLLVHRDLKPGNVLVDNEGQVKLLDFGIAKALDPLEHAQGDTTVAGQRPYTPNYASPEQIRGEPVTTATDIYSLGVLLYQMLTGTRPTGRRATTAAEAARSVLEDEPTRPSRLSASEAVDPHWLATRKKLEGDLDNILLKALAKQPAERYASVDALAADIHAYLEGRPVSARAASPGYVLSKWLGRHRAAAVAATLGGLGLLTGLLATLLQGRVALALGALGLGAGLVLALVQAQRAQVARDEAARSRDDATRHLGELRKLANSMVFDVNDALEHGLIEGRRQLVHAAAQSLERQAGFGQLSDAERIELGMALSRLARLEGHEFTNNLGNVPGALAQYDNALKVLEPLAPRQQDSAAWHGAMAGVLEGRFAVMRTLRRAPDALASIERAAVHAARAAALAPEDMRWRSQECAVLAQLADHTYPIVRFHGLRTLDAARGHIERALRCSERLVAWAPTHLRALRMRGYVMRLHAGYVAIDGRLLDAVAAEHDALQVLEHAMALPGGEALRASDFGPASIRVAITQRAAGLYDEAAAVLVPALALAEAARRENLGDEHLLRVYIATLQTVIDIGLHRGDEAGAALLYDEAHRLLPPLPDNDLMGKRHWNYAWMDTLMALCLVRLGQTERAEGLTLRLRGWMRDGPLRLRDPTGALDAELEANIHIACAHVAAARGQLGAAAAAAEAAIERLQEMQAVRDPRDAVEGVRAWVLLVRLAQAPFEDSAAGRDLRSGFVARARRAQADLMGRGVVTAAGTGARRETRWLAGEPA